jgi:hypothetical protein
MANAFTTQTIKDTTEHAVIKLTGKFDGSGQEDNHMRISANSLYGALATNGFPVANVHGGSANTPLSYYNLLVNRIWYNCTAPAGDVQLFWHADTAISLMFLSGNGEFDGMGTWTTIPNNARGTANCIGDIGIQTRGMAANTSYTIIMELRKDNAQYQRGQFNDPAAFNYPPYGIRP